MTTNSLLSRARKGNLQAITSALNYVIQTLEVIAKVTIKADVIFFILEKTEGIPAQVDSERYIKHFLEHTQIVGISQAEIFAKNVATQSLAWHSKFAIVPKPTQPNPTNQPSKPMQNQASKQSTHYLFDIFTTVATTTSQCRIAPPIPFEQLSQNLQESIRRAGLRAGETRSLMEAQQLYAKIPENIRRSPDAISDFRQAHDWSHKHAYNNGGSAHPSNGDWELSSINRARGGRDMTSTEKQAMAKAKVEINFRSGAEVVFHQAAKSAGIAFGVELAFSGLENFIAVQNGEKSIETALVDTLTSAAGVAITAAVVTGGVVALSLAFPPFGAAVGAAVPFLQIVGVASCVYRLVNILANSGKVSGMEGIMAGVDRLMLSYGLDDLEIRIRILELDDYVEKELARLKAYLLARQQNLSLCAG